LERALPARLAPPRSPEGTAVVLVMDKSSSMEGRKIELARLAAIGVVENLRPIDSVGVLIFDNSFQWAVPMRKAEDRAYRAADLRHRHRWRHTDRSRHRRSLPAHSPAIRRLQAHRAPHRRHFRGRRQLQLTKEALANHVTISTVGLGQDVNRAFLEKVASSADGKSYFLNDPSGLEQILLRDVEEHTGLDGGREAVHGGGREAGRNSGRRGHRESVARAQWIRAFPATPHLRRYPDTADKEDPLLVRWQYGLGRAVVFTSDAKEPLGGQLGHLAGLRPPVGQHLPRHSAARFAQSETTADFDRASNELVMEYRLSHNLPEPAAIPDIFALGPGGFQALAQGGQSGRRPLLRPSRHRRRTRGCSACVRWPIRVPFPEVGFYRQEDEMTGIRQ
jgi:Ca-activated chloride channel family protein